jgi:DNA-binding NarL/FixJ family response regulator
MLMGIVSRTLIIERQMLFAKALAQVLAQEPTIEVVGDATNVTEPLLKSSRPNLILFDLDGNDVDFAEMVQFVRGVLPNVKFCALSMHLHPEVMQRCLTAGAEGYIVKDILPAEFVRAVKSVASGETYVDPRIAGKLLRRRSAPGRFNDPCDLSVRETEVVRLIVAGMSNKEISSKLGLSEKTIKNHVSRVFSKFNCTARTQAAVFAIRSGIV